MSSEMLTKIAEYLPMVLFMGIFYFMMIVPQRKKATQHHNFLNGLKKGDHIVTSSGIFGTIERISDQQVHLHIAQGVMVVEKVQIARMQEQSAVERA
jgi:preprotein translocase subunit YajC